MNFGYSLAGMPNAYDERFNRTCRTEILNARAVSTLEEVRDRDEAWRQRDNTEWTHDSFGCGAAVSE